MSNDSGAERVRKHRARRKQFGVIEIRIWVKSDDKQAALDAVAPYREAAQKHMNRRLGYQGPADIPKWLRPLI